MTDMQTELERVSVDAKALDAVLRAMTGPPYLARELRVLFNLYHKGGTNEIDPLTQLFNDRAAINELSKPEAEEGTGLK